MEVLNTIIFYILTLICLISAAFCFFQKSVMNSLISAIALFMSLSGFYFLLNAPYLACIQILLWGLSTLVLMLFCTSMANSKKEEKFGFLFNIKTIISPVLAAVFAFLTIPFILYQFKGYKALQNTNMTDFALNLYKNNSLAFELVAILLFAAVIGITAVIVIKNTLKSGVLDKSKKGENI